MPAASTTAASSHGSSDERWLAGRSGDTVAGSGESCGALVCGAVMDGETDAGGGETAALRSVAGGDGWREVAGGGATARLRAGRGNADDGSVGRERSPPVSDWPADGVGFAGAVAGGGEVSAGCVAVPPRLKF